MGKRGPKTVGKKESRNEEPAEQAPAESTRFQVFTPKFYNTLDSFKGFYREVLALKSKEQGSDLSGEFADVAKRVSGRLEDESNKILREELADIEAWVGDQQKRTAGDITKIEGAYKANADSLESTGAFSKEEIRQQLAKIQERIDEKRATYDSYGALLERSRQIYE